MFLWSGTVWKEGSQYFATRNANPNMGSEQDENVADYGLNYINSKRLSNVKIGDYNNTLGATTDSNGAIKGYQDSVTGKYEMAFWDRTTLLWRRFLAGVALRNDLVNQQLVTDDYIYIINLFTGNSQLLDPNGVPVIQRGQTSMGDYQPAILLNGGSF
jgi:hypothetical protein